MKVIDARSGEVLTPGQTVRYGDGGEWLRLDDVEAGLFSAKARLTYRHQQPDGTFVLETNRLVPLTVRWLHPSFLFQHVAFIPS